MQEFYHKIRDPIGIHIRPAGSFVRQALQFDSDVELYCNGRCANGKRLFSVLMLQAVTGDEMRIRVAGTDEGEAAKNLMDYLRKYA